MFDSNLIQKSNLLFQLASKLNIKIAVAESCTAGLFAALITEVSGSSAIFERGFITYSDLAKEQLLNIDKNIIKKFGAVSSEVAEAMAIGAINNSAANLSVAITGIAGPSGGSEEKPVGLVHIASYLQLNNELINKKFYFSGNRKEIRIAAVNAAIDILINQIKQL
jgi:nicotinamide-nucleotide amidase